MSPYELLEEYQGLHYINLKVYVVNPQVPLSNVLILREGKAGASEGRSMT